MTTKIKILLSLLTIVFIFSCKRKVDDSVIREYKFEYFPLAVSNWIIYDVDSITYNDIDTPAIVTISSYQIREEITSTFLENENRVAYYIERQRKNNGDSVWNPFDAGYAYLTSNTAERVEDNLRFIKLMLPPIKDREWKGNVYIGATAELAWYADWNYTYSEIYNSRTYNGLNFDSTLYIIQVNDTIDDFTKMKYSSEIYAKNVGMVYKKIMKLEKQTLAKENWVEKATKGFILEMKINDYKR